MKNASRFVLLSATLVACGATVPLGAIDQAVGPNDAGDAGGPDAIVDAATEDAGEISVSSWEIQPCADPSGPIHQYTSVADVQARNAGGWFLCSGGLGWSPTDAMGIELTANEAHYLVQSGAMLVRGSSPDYDRTFTVLPGADGTYGLTFWSVDHDSQNSYFTRTSEDGRFLELNEGTSGKVARYVRAKPLPSGL